MKTFIYSLAAVVISASNAQASVLESFFGNLESSVPAAEVIELCQSAPKIIVDIEIQNPTITRDASVINNPDLYQDDILEGMAITKYGYEASLNFEVIETITDGCTRLSSITVFAGFEQPKIWIRPSLKRGSCSYNVTLQHELEHIGHFHDYLRNFERSLRYELPVLLKGRNFISKKDLTSEKAVQKLEDMATKNIEKLSAHWHGVASRKNDAMDTTEEYDRLQNMYP
jgi:hypothetical protein